MVKSENESYKTQIICLFLIKQIRGINNTHNTQQQTHIDGDASTLASFQRVLFTFYSQTLPYTSRVLCM